MTQFITGIQQVGIGVTNADEAKHLYKDIFGMNVLVFEDKAAAALMTSYTGGQLHHRHAILSLNISGGGGFEIWQYTSRRPSSPIVPVKLGDLGLFAIKIKAKSIKTAHAHLSQLGRVSVTEIMIAPDDRPHFWLTDPYGNHFNIVEGDEWFKTSKGICGGVVGAVIGVSNMEKAIHFYKDILGIDKTIYKGIAPMIDVPSTQFAGQVFNRVLLKKQVANKGAFSKLLGSVQIELIQIKEGKPERIFNNRYWGDCGFIHLCFDVIHMDGLKQLAANAGFSFSIDSSNSFSMGSSAGRFCYVEDPDGTMIELVETHKVPILKKLGWYLNLKERKGDKRLPDWVIGMMALNKIH